MTKSRRCWGRRLVAALVAVSFIGANPVFAAEVNGIWSEASTTDVGKTLGAKALEGVKVRGWVSTYYNHRVIDTPNQSVTNPATPSAGLTPLPGVGTGAITGRAFNTRNRSFSVDLAEVEIEKVPEVGGAGFKLDLAFGDTQDAIFDGVTALNGNTSLTKAERHFQHATVSYIAPLGKGLRVDFGKMVTHIGPETIESIKNNHLSHSYYFTFAIPFQQTGLRLNYAWADWLWTDLYVLNGWNSTFDENRGTSVGPSVGGTWGPLSWWFNYLVGQESDYGRSATKGGGAVTGALTGEEPITGPGGCIYVTPAPGGGAAGCPVGSRSTTRHLVDAAVMYSKDALSGGASFVWGNQQGILGPDGYGASTGGSAALTEDRTRTVKWWGSAYFLGYKLNDSHEARVRYEMYVDPDNFTMAQAPAIAGGPTSYYPAAGAPGSGASSGIATRFQSLTLTWNWKLAKNLLLRPEFRYDKANRRTPFFLPTATSTNSGVGGLQNIHPISSQAVFSANAIYYF